MKDALVLPTSSLVPASLEVTSSPGLGAWLQEQSISLGFTTYQTNRLFLIGTTSTGRIAAQERLFDKPMGLYADRDRLYLSTRYQLWQLENRLAPGDTYQGGDRLYVPNQSYTTGDLNVHDVVLDRAGRLLFVNTDFSCLATLRSGYSFEPIWKPPFISKLAAEDRCHLNGLAMVEGEPTYMTACSATDSPAGWRDHRVNGGVVLHLPSNEIIATGLSMPHSPRWYQGKLWLLNSGTGELGYVEDGRFTPITFCPGFVRGLAFWNQFALVGLSKLRSRSFSSLALEERLAQDSQQSQCGLRVIDLTSGEILHSLNFDGVVEELFDLVVLPGVACPKLLGFQDEDIERLISFPGSGGLITTKPTVKRASRGKTPPIAGLPRSVQEEPRPLPESISPPLDQPIKLQRVYHLNPESLAPYDAFTFPSLQKRWQTQPQRGELVGVSASANGELIGFAIAELFPDHTAELLSLFVSPPYRQRRIGTRLVGQVLRALQSEGGPQVQVNYGVTALTTTALEPLLHTLGWQPPQTTFLLAQTTTERIAQAPWLTQHPLPEAFTVFPWQELTAADRTQLQFLEVPGALSPLADPSRLEPLNSLGLRYGDRLIGWMITHRVAADTIRYSTLFVAPPFRAKAQGISLLSAAIQRQMASSVPHYKFAVAAENTAMRRFLHRHLQPYLTGIGESRRAGLNRTEEAILLQTDTG